VRWSQENSQGLGWRWFNLWEDLNRWVEIRKIPHGNGEETLRHPRFFFGLSDLLTSFGQIAVS